MTGNDTNDLFKKSIDKFLGRSYERNSIGILQEKTLHSIVKDFYAPSDDAKEIRVGDFVADICYEDKIVEIQNGNFTHLVPKLEAFLPKYKVTVVYPIPYRKWMCWIDPETGELTKRNAPRGCFNLYKVFRDLYSIRKYLDHPGFTLILTCLELEEYRLLDGWSKDHKKGSHRYDRIPLNLLDEIVIKGKEGYNRFLPDELTDEFTIKEFQKLVRYHGKYFGTAIKVLEQLGLIERCGMRKRAYLYRKVDSSKGNIIKDNNKKDNNKNDNKTENKEMAVKKTKTATKKTASKAATTKTATKAKNVKVSEETVIDRFLRYVDSPCGYGQTRQAYLACLKAGVLDMIRTWSEAGRMDDIRKVLDNVDRLNETYRQYVCAREDLPYIVKYADFDERLMVEVADTDFGQVKCLKAVNLEDIGGAARRCISAPWRRVTRELKLTIE